MSVDVVVSGDVSPERLASLRRLFADWEATFSRFRDDSELSRVNASPAETVVVSALFARAVRAALAAARATDGLVDPTLGGALVAVGYDRDSSLLRPDPRLPGAPVSGTWRSVSISGRVLSRPPGTMLDLNGVVKSLAVDEALRLLSPGSSVSAGGDLATSGEVVVALPGGGSVRLLSGGIATSGTTRRRWQRGGVDQHHLIDSRTGRPSYSCWDEVTVAAASCLSADVAARAAFLHSVDGPDWLDERGLPGRFLSCDAVVENNAWRLALSTDAVAA